VIGIDADYLVHDAGVAVRAVNYDSTYFRDFVRAGLMMLQTEFQKTHPFGELGRLVQFFAADLFAFKEATFAREQEVRISRMIRRDPTMEHGYRDIGGHDRNKEPLAALPLSIRGSASGACLYTAMPLNLGGISSIRSIGFGPRCSEETERQVKSAIGSMMSTGAVWRSEAMIEG